jgi:ABC-type lipoprotein release transport system permease subunit
VTAVWYRFRAELRTRWRAWLGLGLLVGLAAGSVLALAAGARRTDSAYSRFLRAQAAYDVIVVNYEEDGAAVFDDLDEVAALPMVEESAVGQLGLIPEGSGITAVASPDGRIGTDINRFKMLDGRRAHPGRASEVVVGFTVAEEHELQVGSTLELDGVPGGRLQVVGIEAAPGEFPPQQQGDRPLAHLTPAFYRLGLFDDPASSSPALFVRLSDGSAGVDAFQDQLDRLSEGRELAAPAQQDHATVVQRSIHLQAVTLWILAGLVAVTTALILGQLLTRLTLVEAREHPTLRALGWSERDRILLGLVRTVAIALIGTIAGVALAVAASPLLPTGLARTAEADPGVRVDVAALGLGALATLALVTALGAWASWRAVRVTAGLAVVERDARLRPSGVGRLLAESGWPLPATLGVRMALEPGRGSTAVPVRTTLAGVTLGVVALVAALTFGASLGHLLDSPRLYGLTWDVELSNYTDDELVDRGIGLLDDDPRVEAVGMGGAGSPIAVEGRRVDVIVLSPVKGDVTPPILDGRAPYGPNEIALGSRTMRTLGVEVGDMVEAGLIGVESVPLQVVGRAVFPSVSDVAQLGEGALITREAAIDIAPDYGYPSDLFLRLAPDADAQAVVADLNQHLELEASALRRGRPTDVVNFGRVEAMPFVLGGILAAVAAAALAHLLLSAVRRRRRDLAILKTLGFVRRQVAEAVAWQATTVVLLGLLVGTPLGVALGRWLWTLLADNLGVVPQPEVPVLALVAVSAGAVVLANAIALVPGQMAARTQAVTDLRSE